MGASSGIGYAVAKRLIEEGWMVGLSARRLEPLETLTQLAPERVFTQRIDITDTEATTPLSQLIARLGGIDLYFHASGIGKQNTLLDESIEQATLATNVMGFARMVDFVFNYMSTTAADILPLFHRLQALRVLAAQPRTAHLKHSKTLIFKHSTNWP